MSLIPEGVKIYFGATLDKKIAIEKKITTLFEKNCYKLIELPMYEYYSDLEESFSENMKKNMFKFVDRDSGRIVALRPDMTSLLAKLMKLKKDEILFPERIYYNGAVFRYHKIKSGVYREMCQAGVELIGAKGYKADIEVLIMAIEVMKELGLKNPKIEIGDIRVLNSILDKNLKTEEEKNYIKELIAKKDIPGLQKEVSEKGYDSLLAKLPLMIGSKEVVEEAAGYGIEEIKFIVETLEKLGYGDNYVVDLGIVKEMEYYTGIVFNGFCEGSGDFIINGGRYDGLMGFPALGFVINVDAVVEIADKQEEKDKSGVYIVSKDYLRALKAKAKQIENGERAEISAFEESDEKSEKEYAKAKGFKLFYDADADKLTEL